jgi:hypothetical protein
MKTEHEEQRELVQWFRRSFLVRIFAIPNGGARSAGTGARLKAEGVSAGVPDLFVPAWNLWIEMKNEKGGTISASQRDWIEYLEGIGHTVIMGNGKEDAMDKVNKFISR